MLTRLFTTVVNSQRQLTISTIRLLNTSTIRLSDGDHLRSKAQEKAANDLKTRKEQRWLDTVASDSEAIVKAEKQADLKKDLGKLQKDTINAIKDKEAKGYLLDDDVGRNDSHEERIGSGASTKPIKH